jgi:hypothetical protein
MVREDRRFSKVICDSKVSAEATRITLTNEGPRFICPTSHNLCSGNCFCSRWPWIETLASEQRYVVKGYGCENRSFIAE